ncbi:MAG: AraC family transcriptional regulator [Reyranellaceae bacterium]
MPDVLTLAPVVPGTTRVASLVGLPAVLAQRGVALAPLLRAVGLPADLFEHPERPLPLATAMRLLDCAAARAECPHLGLLCGQRLGPQGLGLAGQLALNASDVGSGLRGLGLNLHLNGHAFMLTLTRDGDSAEFGVRPLGLPGDATVGIDLGVAAAFTVLRLLAGPGWQPQGVVLARRPPAGRAAYARFFGVPVSFDGDRNGIVFDASWLARPVHGASAARRERLERALTAHLQRHPLPPVEATRRALIVCLSRGRVSVAAVAATLGLHPRTLNRQLQREGTSVAALLKEVRLRIARDLLAGTALPVTDVAATLLYANLGAFTRAFRQWTGESPRTWRGRNSTIVARP